MAKILITGGTGYLGKRLALALKERHDVVLAARNSKINLLAGDYTGCQVLPMDITRIESVRDAVIEARPHLIIHAAAMKYVDLAEQQPLDCTDVNVLGSENVARVAMERGVRDVVAISTDKAAPPVRNTYALTKALMERIYCGLNGKSDTRFNCVRFGNLAWSTGSVLPVWKKMHDTTGVIGTTGPEMRRFFITVDQAIALIRTAWEEMDELQGRVITRSMKAVQISDVLETWIKHKGGSWERIAGRPGERDDEYLVGDAELLYTREHEFGGIVHYSIGFNDKVEQPFASELSSATAERLSEEEILQLIINPPPAEEL